MAKLTPAEFADKQATRLKGAVEDIRKGVDRVKDSPTAKAAAKKDKYLSGISDAVSSGKWQRGLMAVNLTDWQESMKEKGLNRIASGIDGARPKVMAFAEKLNAFQDNLKKDIDKMPDNTREDRINKMTAWVRGMAKFSK